MSLSLLRQMSGRASGSASPAFEDSGRWPRAGTRREHRKGLSDKAGRGAGCASDARKHLYLLSFTPRRYIGVRFGEPARHVSGALIDRTRHLPSWHLRTTPWLELAIGKGGAAAPWASGRSAKATKTSLITYENSLFSDPISLLGGLGNLPVLIARMRFLRTLN